MSAEQRLNELKKHALPDARFHLDLDHDVCPDFRGSSIAIDRLAALPAYRTSKTLLISPANCLQLLRFRALKDGKTLLVATHRLKRGFVLLQPNRINEARYEFASCLDGMEKSGIGRQVTLAQLQDEGVKVDAFIAGALFVESHECGTQGLISTLRESNKTDWVQWSILNDREVAHAKRPVIVVAPDCSVIGIERGHVESDAFEDSSGGQADFVITPKEVLKVRNTREPSLVEDFNQFSDDMMNNMPPLSELMGIKMMEKIMKKGGLGEAKDKPVPNLPTADEQMGINMIERIMKGYRA